MKLLAEESINKIIPVHAQFIVDSLIDNGYEAYFVGGCVRDLLLNRTPHDWDICTAATPDKVNEIFNKIAEISNYRLNIIPTGIKHGTLTVGLDDAYFEVTTFRVDGNYTDCRRPDDVSFTSDIVQDLSRRDFTINSIAYNSHVGFVDPFHGIEDIQQHVIKCVGDPDCRFNEDGLRVLRAIRFAAQLNFDIETKTQESIHRNKRLIDNISRERIQSELCKILNCPCCGSSIFRNYIDIFSQFIPNIDRMRGIHQASSYHPWDVWEHTLHSMEYLAYSGNSTDDIILRLALLLHDIGKPLCESALTGHFHGHEVESATLAKIILTELKFSREIIDDTVQLILNHVEKFTPTGSCVKRLLNKLGETQLKRLIELRRCDIHGQAVEYAAARFATVSTFEDVMTQSLLNNECYKLNQLHINGDDIIRLGVLPGIAVGKLLQELLYLVIDEKIENDKQLLIEKAKTLIGVAHLNE